MSDQPLVTSPELQRALERFYFHEARLLDNRQYQQYIQYEIRREVRTNVPVFIHMYDEKCENELN